MSATVTQNDCAPAIRCQTLCCWTSSTDSIETLAGGGGLAALADIRTSSSRVDGAGDQTGHFFGARRLDRFVRDLAAAAHHHDPVANRENVGHPMADEHDRHAGILEAPD